MRRTKLPLVSFVAVLAAAVAGSALLSTSADARKRQRYAQPRYYQPKYYNPPGYYRAPRGYSRERQLCEERAQAEDPTGLYAGYPCWARESFGRGSSGGRR